MSASLPSYWRELIASLPHEWWAWWRGRSDVLQAALGHPPSAAEIRRADEIAAADCLGVIDAYDSYVWQQTFASEPGTGTEKVHRVA